MIWQSIPWLIYFNRLQSGNADNKTRHGCDSGEPKPGAFKRHEISIFD